MADLTPEFAKFLAKCVRMLHNDNLPQRRIAFTALEDALEKFGADFRDLGNWIEQPGTGKYSEAEVQEICDVVRKESVEAGIKLGLARASNGGGNGRLTLPPPAEMADFCHTRRGQLKDDDQRKFIDEMIVSTRRYRLKPGTLGYLASLYIKHGGKT